jgi:tripartite-type tricarboxylate transporter receptor subunit TctC
MNRKMKKETGRRMGIWMLQVSLLLSIMVLSVPSSRAADEPYPNRQVNVVVPFTAGGMLDLQSKVIGDKLSEILGQPFIRVHKPGGGGALGASFVARAKPDGYTLFPGTSSSLVLTPILKKLDYKLEDFIPLAIYSRVTVFLAVKSDAKWKTLADFVEDAKKHPGTFRVSSFGKYTHSEFVLEGFSKWAGIKLIHVPYKCNAEAMTALLGGHVVGAFCTTSTGQMEAGTIRVLAVSDYERSDLFPEVKTFKELGFPVSFPAWCALCAPKDTPPKVVDILSQAMKELFKRYPKEIKEEFRRLEVSTVYFNTQDSIQKFKQDYDVLYKAAKELGVAAE